MGRGNWSRIIEVYSDGTNVFYKVEAPLCKFVFDGEELVSYVCWLGDRFYIRHYGKGFKGRVVEGEKFSVMERRAELEIEVKKGGYGLWVSYIPLGRRLTPFIRVVASGWDILILPEINRIYQGKEVLFRKVSGGIHVLVRYAEELGAFVRAYILMPNGGEYLMYDGSYYTYLSTPYELYKLRGANALIVEFKNGKEWVEDFEKYFCRAPELNYLFVRSYYEKGKVFELSFDMDTWTKVRASEMGFKSEAELRSKGMQRVPEETIRVIEGKIQKALEEIETNFLKPYAGKEKLM